MTEAERTRQWGPLVFGGALVFALGWVTGDQCGRARVVPDATSKATANVAPEEVDAGTKPSVDAGLDAASPDAGDASLALAPLDFTLPKDAPKTVRVGVVLVQFAGAEAAPASAPSKTEAGLRAAKLVETARSNFKQAVHDGDSGSSEDIGRIPHGTLDPATEATVFRLASGQVSDVIETPRGYWIVKRID